MLDLASQLLHLTIIPEDPSSLICWIPRVQEKDSDPGKRDQETKHYAMTCSEKGWSNQSREERSEEQGRVKGGAEWWEGHK